TATHPSCAPVGRISGYDQRDRPPLHRAIHLRRRLAAERSVRADVVEVDEPAIHLELLRSSAPCRPELELAEVPVHPLVTAVVLRAAWPCTDQADAERHQPGR